MSVHLGLDLGLHNLPMAGRALQRASFDDDGTSETVAQQVLLELRRGRRKEGPRAAPPDGDARLHFSCVGGCWEVKAASSAEKQFVLASALQCGHAYFPSPLLLRVYIETFFPPISLISRSLFFFLPPLLQRRENYSHLCAVQEERPERGNEVARWKRKGQHGNSVKLGRRKCMAWHTR